MFHLTSMSTGKRNASPSAVSFVHECGRDSLFCTTLLHLLPLYAAYILFLSRGMKFENVQILTDAISDIITDMKWAW